MVCLGSCIDLADCVQGLGASWQESAPGELKTKLGMAVRQLKDQWRIGTVLKLSSLSSFFACLLVKLYDTARCIQKQWIPF